jgi:hypothetical protein
MRTLSEIFAAAAAGLRGVADNFIEASQVYAYGGGTAPPGPVIPPDPVYPPVPPGDGTLPAGPITPCTAADNWFVFVAEAGACYFVTAYSPAYGPYPGDNVTMTVLQMDDSVIVGPTKLTNGNSQGSITASALTPGESYKLRVQRDQAGGAYVKYN